MKKREREREVECKKVLHGKVFSFLHSNSNCYAVNCKRSHPLIKEMFVCRSGNLLNSDLYFL